MVSGMQTPDRPLPAPKVLHNVRPSRFKRFWTEAWTATIILGYGIGARWDAWGHVFRGHNVIWREDPDLWTGITGSITCRTCPDTNEGQGGNDLCFWVRHWAWMGWVGERICGLIGHPLFQHPKQHDQYLEGQVYCFRCTFEAPLRKVWLEDSEE